MIIWGVSAEGWASSLLTFETSCFLLCVAQALTRVEKNENLMRWFASTAAEVRATPRQASSIQ